MAGDTASRNSYFQRHRRDRVSSRLRLRGFDYNEPATYFVTICTQDRACLFGSIEGGAMVLSPAGTVIESWWHSIPWRFPQAVTDAMVVMPNHLHGVLMLGASPGAGVSLPTLSAIMQWFKGVSTNDYMLGVRSYGWPPFNGRLWQKGFYEHIVRTESDLRDIRAYISDNPAMWTDDEENPDTAAR